jgi:hypothetical protein
LSVKSVPAKPIRVIRDSLTTTPVDRGVHQAEPIGKGHHHDHHPQRPAARRQGGTMTTMRKVLRLRTFRSAMIAATAAALATGGA